MVARSYLFVPGDRPDRFSKALASGADAIILDLEDAVSEGKKAEACEVVSRWLSTERPVLKYAHVPVYVRVNGPATERFRADLEALANTGPTGVVLPKAEDPEQIGQVVAHLTDRVRIIPIIETALGLWRAVDLARSPGVERLAFGAIDFKLDTGIGEEGGSEGNELLYARSHLVLGSRVANILQPIDGVTTELDNKERLAADVERARRIGFGAKLCVHPRQVTLVNQGFGITKDEIAWARRVLDAAVVSGSGAFRLGDEMVDRPVMERAKKILNRAREN